MFGKSSVTFLSSAINLKRTFGQDVQNSFFDVIISGGGMVGQTMACALSKNPVFKNYKILLIESSEKKDYNTPLTYSNRVSSVVPSTKDLFVKLGMWQNISRYQEVKDMKIWGSYSDEHVKFTHDVGNPAYIIENDEIINSAIIENSSSKNLQIIYGKTVKKVNLSSNTNLAGHEVQLNDGSILKTSLLIGADGANSSIRSAMNTNYISWKYHQFGIVATLNVLNGPENSTAWQKFLPDGPIALLPLKSGLSSLVWSVTEKKAKDLINLPEEIFIDALNKGLTSDPIENEAVNKISGFTKSLFGRRKSLPVVPLMPPHISSMVKGTRAMFPLSFGHSSEYYKHGVVLIGDSAHKVHPLAGQGVNLGFRDIRCLEDNLTQGIMNGRPLGHSHDLKNYETEAQRNSLPLMVAIDLFHRVYTSKNTLMNAIGDVSINIAKTIHPLKSMMKQLATS